MSNNSLVPALFDRDNLGLDASNFVGPFHNLLLNLVQVFLLLIREDGSVRRRRIVNQKDIRGLRRFVREIDCDIVGFVELLESDWLVRN